jgi:hypothetical protein
MALICTKRPNFGGLRASVQSNFLKRGVDSEVSGQRHRNVRTVDDRVRASDRFRRKAGAGTEPPQVAVTPEVDSVSAEKSARVA